MRSYTSGNGASNGTPEPSAGMNPDLAPARLGESTEAHAMSTRAREVTLKDLLDILLKGKWTILSCFFIVVSAVALYTFLQEPEYESESIVIIQTTQSKTQRLEDILMGQGNRNVFNEMELLHTRSLASQVAKRMLRNYSPTGSETPTGILKTSEGVPLTERLVRDRLMAAVRIRPVNRDVDLIRIVTTSTDADQAAQIANIWAEEYLISNQTDTRKQVAASKQFLEAQLSKFDEQLASVERDLETFQEEEGVTLDTETQQLVASIGSLQTQRDEVIVKLGIARAARSELEKQLNEVSPNLRRSMTSGTERRMKTTEERMIVLESEIEEVYAKNPELRGNEQANAGLTQKIEQRAEFQRTYDTLMEQYFDEVDSMGGIDPSIGAGGGNPIAFIMQMRKEISDRNIEIAGLESSSNILSRRLSDYNRQLDRVPGKAIQQRRLERDRESRAEIHGLIAQRLQEARIAEESEVGYAKIVDDAIVNSRPVRPRVALNVVLGSLFGLVLGLCIVFLRNSMDNRIRKPEDLRKFGISVIGVISDMTRSIKSDFEGRETVASEGRSYSTSLIALLNPLSPLSEAYRRLRTNIQFSMPDDRMQVIMTTSSGPGEGKTVTTANLAITMAQAGRKTLYIDADLRRPTGHKLFGLSREPGLVEILFGKQAVDLSSFETGIDDLYAISAGSSVPNPAELMGSRKMKEFIARLRNEFDFIVIDTPPVLAVTDSVLLSTLVDGVVVVVSANETDWHSFGRTLDSLVGVGAPVIGAVLNRFNAKTAYGYYRYRYSYGYGYGYGSGYYDYYGERGGEKKKKKRLTKKEKKIV